MDNAAAWIEGVALLLNIVLLPAAGVWKLSRVELSIREEIEKSRTVVDARVERNAREVGETISAIREKVREVELFCRDTFMRRDSFVHVQANLEGAIRDMGRELKDRLERMEDKIDEAKAARDQR